jgi:DNA repair protein RadB
LARPRCVEEKHRGDSTLIEAGRRIPTGSGSLDVLLSGGLARGGVVLVYGEPASGKTTLAISAAANLLRIDHAARVLYIDSDAKFTPTRLTQMTGDEGSLRRLVYVRPSTFEEQAEAIDHLPDKLQRGDLACVDSVTGLYRVETGDTQKTFSENKELNRQLGSLKETALTMGVAVLLTGQVRSVLDSPVPTVEPVAQRLLRYWSDTVIRIESTATQGVKQATVEKPEGLRGATRFAITQTGIGDEQRW